MIILKITELQTILIIIISFFLLYILFVSIFAYFIHKMNFQKRIDKYSYINDKDHTFYKNLKLENYSFFSNKIKINGEIYFYDTKDNKDIIIFSNGFNTTIKKYISEIEYLSSQGYAF